MINIDGYIFEGSYSELCAKFVEYKRDLGYRYADRQLRAVLQMNNFLSAESSESGSDQLTLPKEYACKYIECRPGEKVDSAAKREGLIRQFALFLNKIGVAAYIVPNSKRWARSKFVPYIFSKHQIADLLCAADSLAPDYRSPHYQYVYPLFFRLLYCCGLRLGEALRLKIKDIDFDRQLVRVEQAKFNNSRMLPMSGSLFCAMQKYMEQTGLKPNDSGLLFRTIRNEPYGQTVIRTRFKRLLACAGVPGLANGRTQRIHDFRHTFAVHSLDAMHKQGLDANNALMYLMVYMGHRALKDTEYYLRFTAESFEQITTALAPLYVGLFPREVSSDEEEH